MFGGAFSVGISVECLTVFVGSLLVSSGFQLRFKVLHRSDRDS